MLKLYEAAIGGADVRTIRRRAENAGLDRLPEGDPKSAALGWVGYLVHEVISKDCYPAFYQLGTKFSPGYGFHTLLGAMYLQMAWVMASKKKVYCKWCRAIVNFEDPPLELEKLEEAGYKKSHKTHSNKAFCSPPCYQKWYYQNVTKPKREAS